MPMNARLLRPRASGSVLHPDASDWITRVTANGGSASSTTLAAVSTFCAAIQAAGIRDRFYRLNLFCGTGLNAVLVPLYRNTSLTGSGLGNTTDTNNNFVSGDYVELGSNTGGLKGNGSSKWLNTGLNPVTVGFSVASHHLSVYVKGTEASGTSRAMIGNANTGDSPSALFFVTSGTAERFTFPQALAQATSGGTSIDGMLTGTVEGGESNYYRGTASQATSEDGSVAFPDRSYAVFASQNTPGGVFLYSLARYFRAYSLGLGLTSAQLTAYYNAMQAFQTALDRQV